MFGKKDKEVRALIDNYNESNYKNECLIKWM